MKNLIRKATAILFAIVVYGIFSTSFSLLAPQAPIWVDTCVGSVFGIASLVTSFYGVVGLGIDNLNIEDTSWSGKALQYMLTRAVYDVDTIINGCACVLEEISRKAITIPRLEVTVLMQAYNPEPTARGGQTVDRQVLTLQKFELYDEFDPQDYEVHYFEQDYDETRLIDETLPATAENFTMLQYMKRINKWIEDSLWNSRLMWNPAGGNVAPVTKGYPDNTLQSGTNYFFDGFIYKMLQDATVQTVAYNPANFTSANFRESQLNVMLRTLILNPISKALAYKYGKEGLRYLMSYADQNIHEEAQRTDLYKNQDSTQYGLNRFAGYDVVPLAGLDSGTVILSLARPDYNSNFFVGTNTTEDVMLEMGRKPKPSKLWYVNMIMKLDVTHGWGDQAILTTPVNA